MVIANLDVIGIAVNKAETDPPLIVDGDRVLTLSISFERVEPVARWYLQIVQPRGQIHILQLASSPFCDVSRKPLGLTSSVEFFGPSIRERLDHLADCNASRDARQPPRHERITLKYAPDICLCNGKYLGDIPAHDAEAVPALCRILSMVSARRTSSPSSTTLRRRKCCPSHRRRCRARPSPVNSPDRTRDRGRTP